MTKELADVPADVVEAAQKIWFAGLGALAMAQDEVNARWRLYEHWAAMPGSGATQEKTQ